MKSYHRHWHMPKSSRIRTHYQSRGVIFYDFLGEKFKKMRAHAFHCAELPVTHAHHIHLIITSIYSPSQHPEELFQSKTLSPCITKDVVTQKHLHFFHLLIFSVAKRTPSKQPVQNGWTSMVISNPFFHGKDSKSST